MTQGFKACAAEFGCFPGTGELADFKSLIAQAMPVFQKHQIVMPQFRQGQLVLCGKGMPGGHGHKERLFKQQFGMKMRVMNRQGQKGRIERTLYQARDQRIALFLKQEQLKAGKRSLIRGTTCGSR